MSLGCFDTLFAVSGLTVETQDSTANPSGLGWVTNLTLERPYRYDQNCASETHP